MKIAVVTTCDIDFKRFSDIQDFETAEKLVKIKILNDLRDKQYAKCVLLIESKNVTNTVIKKTCERSLETIAFSFKDVYQKI